jgi:hypothetical protein
VKSKEEVEVKSEIVKAKILEIQGKRKRGRYEGTLARQAKKRQRQLDRRQEVLDLPSPEGRMTTLRERRVLLLKEA